MTKTMKAVADRLFDLLEHAVTELAIGIAIGGVTCRSAVHVNERTGGAGEPGLCLECVARAARAIWRRATTRRRA